MKNPAKLCLSALLLPLPDTRAIGDAAGAIIPSVLVSKNVNCDFAPAHFPIIKIKSKHSAFGNEGPISDRPLWNQIIK